MVSKSLVIIACALAVATAAPTAHVFLIIGQSNSVGLNSGGHTAEDVAYPNILQASCCVNGGANNNQCNLIQAQDPLHHQCDNDFLNGPYVGWGMSFARAFRAEMSQDDIIVLVPAGISATGFVDNVWTAYTGRGFVQALDRLKSAFNALSQNYPQYTPHLAGFLWHQGEADADVNTSTDDYLNKDIIPMINAWRDSNVVPQTNSQVPFVVGNLVPGWVQDPNAQNRLGVFAALQFLDQYVPYSGSTPSLGLNGDPQWGAIHFSASSARILGKRYFAAYKLALTNAPDTA